MSYFCIFHLYRTADNITAEMNYNTLLALGNNLDKLQRNSILDLELWFALVF